MKLFTNKQIELLSPYESHFHTVLFAKYKRATSSRGNDLVADLYEEVSGEIITRNWSCNHCIYSLFDKCGKLYYASLEAAQKAEKEAKTEPKKRGRKSTKNKTEKA